MMLIGSMIFFASCSEDNNDPSGGGDEYLTAKIDGSDFEAATSPASLISGVVNGTVFNVQGGNNSGKTIRLTVQGYSGPGTYDFGGLTNPNMGVLIEDPLNPTTTTFTTFGQSGNAGSVTITSDDGSTVEGTFEFTGSNGSTQRSVTSGVFKAALD